LVHSLPEHGKKEKEGVKKNINSDRNLDKDNLVVLLDAAYKKSTSKEHFLSQIQASGHEIYYRDGRLQGIKFEGERKFRMKNLGYDEKKLMELGNREKSIKEMQELRAGRNVRQKEQAQKQAEKLNGEKAVTSQVMSKEETALKDLREMRQSRTRDMEKSDSRDDSGRDMADDRNDNLNSNDRFSRDDDNKQDTDKDSGADNSAQNNSEQDDMFRHK